MAKRPVFVVKSNDGFVNKVDIEFTYFSGFSSSQKRKNIKSLHDEYKKIDENCRILEISSKSEDVLGVKLSAFNLKLYEDNKAEYYVESAFQGSKIFENGGPFTDLYSKSSLEAKKDERLKNSGNIIGFKYLNEIFGNEPKTFFYNWLYIRALLKNKQLAKDLLSYNAFTDIEFNPKKSLKCQAEAAAIYVSLVKQAKLNEAIENKEAFRSIVYPEYEEEAECTQLSFL